MEEVETALLDLPCNSWTGVSIGDITYYRACETEEQYQVHVMGAPNTGPTPTPTSTPPPHHYLTVEEVETALLDLGCDSWSHFSIGETSYYRACANDDGYQIHVMGAPTNTSGELCTFEGAPNVRFTVAPTDLSQIRSIVPSGSPSGGTIANHSYIHNKSTPASQSGRVPVYAVADSVAHSIAYYISKGGGTNFYMVSFDVSCETGYVYDHIVELAPKIAAVAPATASESSATDRIDSIITFEAGELIGYVGEGSWDFGATDTTQLNQLANPDRYIERNWGDLHTACPYDNYAEPLKSQFYALFGDPGGTLFPTLRCTPTRDLLGSAAGQWFDALDFDTGNHAIGIAMLPGDTVEISTASGMIRVRNDSPSWLNPELLTTSHCYADQGTWYYLEIQAEGMQMALATGTGSCPATLPADATSYYR